MRGDGRVKFQFTEHDLKEMAAVGITVEDIRAFEAKHGIKVLPDETAQSGQEMRNDVRSGSKTEN